MHSFTDCAMGAVMGAVVWAGYWLLEESVESWLVNAGWSGMSLYRSFIYVCILISTMALVPLTIIPLCVIMVNQHPVPVDDCPCFEDAIAFVSVLMGSILGRWHAVHAGFDASFFASSMPGTTSSPLTYTWGSMGLWWGTATLKMVFGIFVIFAWRIFAKSTLHMVLPPTFRFLAQIFTLPHRRFYTPATDYKSVPSDLGLRPIPSVMDLSGTLGMEVDLDADAGWTSGRSVSGNGEVRVRGKLINGVGGTGSENRSWELEKNGDAQVKDESAVKHYDADG